MKKMVVLLLLCLACTGRAQRSTAPPGRKAAAVTYTLPDRGMTSAGIYNAAGRLVRNLWTLEEKEAGTYESAWDGTRNDGSMAPPDRYQLRIVHHRIRYTWEGVVGNHSDQLTGPAKYRGYDVMQTMCISGDTMFCGYGWSEALSGKTWARTGRPNTRYDILPINGAHSQCTYFSCTDGERTYWGGNDLGEAYPYGFVFATRNRDHTVYDFAAGQALTLQYGYRYPSTANHRYGRLSGMAVQQRGNYLFVTREKNDSLFIVHKRTGQLLRIQPGFRQPRGIAVATGDDQLWMITGNHRVGRYRIRKEGMLDPEPLMQLEGLTGPTAIGVEPRSGQVSVTDSSREQVLTYDASGKLLWVLGQPGGYRNETRVAADRFFFNVSKLYGSTDIGNFITYQPDGSFWVADPGNMRVQHFSANRTFLESIGYITANYNVLLDPADSGRLFCMMWEYRVDYRKKLDNGRNGSWSLHRNYAYRIAPPYPKAFHSICTFPNGRTYGLIPSGGRGEKELVELAADGIRFSGRVPGTRPMALYRDGSLRSILNPGGDPPGVPVYWVRQPLLGYDKAGFPRWGDAETLARINQQNGDLSPAGRGTADPVSITTGGIIPVINPFPGSVPDYHVGGVKLGDTAYTFKTAMGTGKAYRGIFPTPDFFDDGNGVNAGAAGMIQAVDSSIFWIYNGEFYRGNQVIKVAHLTEDGLAIGQFGVVGEMLGKQAPAMMAGNAFRFAVTRIGNTDYLYNNDETYHGGVHRWKIEGLNTIRRIVVPFDTIGRNEKAVRRYQPLFDDLPYKAQITGVVGHVSKYPAQSHFGNGQYFIAETGSHSYDQRQQTDIVVTHRRISTKDSVAIRIGNSPSGNWKMTGSLLFSGDFNRGPDGSSAFSLVDRNGRPLLTLKWDYAPDPSYYDLNVNGQVIRHVPAAQWGAVAGDYQPFELTYRNGRLVLRYATFDPVPLPVNTIPVPARLVLYFVQKNEVWDKNIGLMDFRLQQE